MFMTYQTTSISFLRMCMKHKNFVCATAVVLFQLIGASSIAAEEQTVERILETGSDVVELSIVDGTGATTSISTGDTGRVIVETTITGGFLTRWGREQNRKRVKELLRNPPMEQKGNHIKVGDLPWRVRKDLSISYHITVPPNTNVYVSGPENVQVTGLHGNLRVTGGRVVASDIKGDVIVKRAEYVAIDNVRGKLTVTDRAQVIHVDDVIVDLGSSSL